MRHHALWGILALSVAGCDCGPQPAAPDGRFMPDAPTAPDGGFICMMEGQEVCEGNTHTTCILEGEFLSAQREDCAAMDPPKVCVEDLWCVVCRPGSFGCIENDAVQCRDDGSGWDVIEECQVTEGE